MALGGSVTQSMEKSLECPICRGIFENATLLICGHTFCRNCLKSCADSQPNIHNQRNQHIPCPVCRRVTKLGGGVEELPANTSIKTLVDEFHAIKDKESSTCSEHQGEKSDIFCEVCRTLICLSCFIGRHQGHAITKRQDFEINFKKKIESVLQRCTERRAGIKEGINNIELQRQYIQSTLDMLHREIVDERERKVRALFEQEDTLLEELKTLRNYLDVELDEEVRRHSQFLEDISSSQALLAKCKIVDDIGILAAHDLIFSDVKALLENDIEVQSVLSEKKIAQNARFYPADNKFLLLGQLNWEKKVTTNAERQTNSSKHVEKSPLDAAERKNFFTKSDATRDPKSSKLPVGVHTSMESHSLKIVKVVNLPAQMYGMAKMSSDSVVIGYGGPRKGSDCYRVSGEMTEHLKSEVGHVFDLAVFNDGRSVVSHFDGQTIKMYRADGTPTAVRYTCERHEQHVRLCIDHSDNVYVVNGNTEVYVFCGVDTNPQRTVATGGIRPKQISVLKSGDIILSTCSILPSIIGTISGDGRVRSCISTDHQDPLFVACDSQERVYVATIKWESDVFQLSAFTLKDLMVDERRHFETLRLPHRINRTRWSYMVCLTPNLIAFANSNNLYFFEVPAGKAKPH